VVQVGGCAVGPRSVAGGNGVVRVWLLGKSLARGRGGGRGELGLWVEGRSWRRATEQVRRESDRQKGIVHEIVSTDPDEGGKIGQTIVSENSCKCIADPP